MNTTSQGRAAVASVVGFLPRVVSVWLPSAWASARGVARLHLAQGKTRRRSRPSDLRESRSHAVVGRERLERVTGTRRDLFTSAPTGACTSALISRCLETSILRTRLHSRAIRRASLTNRGVLALHPRHPRRSRRRGARTQPTCAPRLESRNGGRRDRPIEGAVVLARESDATRRVAREEPDVPRPRVGRRGRASVWRR